MERRSFLKGLAAAGTAIGATGVGPFISKGLAAKKLEDIGFGAARTSIQGRANLEIQRLELGRLMRQDPPDRAAVDKKLDEVTQAESALRKSMIHGRLDAQAVLTKEQRQKLADLSQRKPFAAGAGAAPATPRPKAGTMREKPAAPPASKPPANI